MLQYSHYTILILFCFTCEIVLSKKDFAGKNALYLSSRKALYFDNRTQAVLSKSIRSVFKQQTKLFNLSSNAINLTPDDSLVTTLCRNDSDLNQRIGCCMPTDMRYLWNVKVVNGEIQVFTSNAGNVQKLPPHNLIQQFRVPIKQVNSQFNRHQHCKSYFNGTLHVLALSTTENTFHLFADNILNHFATILLDAYFYPEMLHLPRKLLIYPGFLYCNTGKCAGSVKHIDILYKSFSGGQVKMEDIDDTCFRRIVWGKGPGLLYDDVLIALRRQTAAFVRSFVHFAYKIPFGKEQVISRRKQNKLKISIIGRENSPSRQFSSEGEAKIAHALRKQGHYVSIYRSMKDLSMTDQLNMAFNTDCLLSLHGAAFANGLLMPPSGLMIELKTSYGWTDSNMVSISDSRMHTHLSIDIRKWTRDKPPVISVTDELVERIVSRFEIAWALHRSGNHSNQLTYLQYRGRGCTAGQSNCVDFIIGPGVQLPAIDHILGPLYSPTIEGKKGIVQFCNNTFAMFAYQRFIGNEPPLVLHCRHCYAHCQMNCK